MYPLGRLVQHDPRSRAYAAAPAVPVPIKSKTWKRHGRVLNQGQMKSCTGHALAHCLNFTPLHRTGAPVLRKADAIVLYSRGTMLDDFPGEYPPKDEGTSGIGVCKAAVERGLIIRYEWAFGLLETLQVLMRQPVIIGTTWYESMFSPDYDGFVTIGGDTAGAHEYVLIGVNVKQRHVIALNSWGYGWGLGGRFRIRFDDLGMLLDDRGDVIAPILG